MEAGSLEHLRSAWLLQQIPQESQTTINSFDTKVFEESHMEWDTEQASCRALPALPQSHLLVISSRGISQDCWGKLTVRWTAARPVGPRPTSGWLSACGTEKPSHGHEVTPQPPPPPRCSQIPTEAEPRASCPFWVLNINSAVKYPEKLLMGRCCSSR